MRKKTERRERFNHLIGVDRCRVVYRFGDGSMQTQSFDEKSEDLAKATAAANMAPCGSERPTTVEIYLGQFVAKGSTDCEWVDSRLLSVGLPSTAGDGIAWTIADGSAQPSAVGQLGLFGRGEVA